MLRGSGWGVTALVLPSRVSAVTFWDGVVVLTENGKADSRRDAKGVSSTAAVEVVPARKPAVSAKGQNGRVSSSARGGMTGSGGGREDSSSERGGVTTRLISRLVR